MSYEQGTMRKHRLKLRRAIRKLLLNPKDEKALNRVSKKLAPLAWD